MNRVWYFEVGPMSVKGSGRLGLPFALLDQKSRSPADRTAQLSLLEGNLSTPHMNGIVDAVCAHGDGDVLVYLKFH